MLTHGSPLDQRSCCHTPIRLRCRAATCGPTAADAVVASSGTANTADAWSCADVRSFRRRYSRSSRSDNRVFAAGGLGCSPGTGEHTGEQRSSSWCACVQVSARLTSLRNFPASCRDCNVAVTHERSSCHDCLALAKAHLLASHP